MSRRCSSTHLFSRNEKRVFCEIINVVKTLINIIVAILKAIPEIINNIKKMIKINKAMEGVGYSYPQILNMIDKITPRQFEIFCAELFKGTGKYTKVEITQQTCDMGRDIILTSKINGYEEITFVEVKHYNKDGFQIGREICQKLLGSCVTFNVGKAIIITTGTYHKNAYEVAGRVNNLQLMDIADIQNMILNMKPEQISRVILRTQNAS